jgi:hypothetical protein
MESEPKRVVLRFHVKHEREEVAINKRFFELYGPKPPNNDFFSHLIAPQEYSNNMYIVLDIRCKSHPAFDNRTIAYEVFNVRRRDELYVKPIFGTTRN